MAKIAVEQNFYMFITKGKGAANNRLTKTININWEKANIAKINGAIDFIKPLVVNKKVSLSDAAKRWEAQNLPQEKKVSRFLH